MFKRFTYTLILIFPTLLFSQQTELLRQEVCWNPGSGPDSSLVRYVLVSPQTSQIQILFYTDASGITVNPVGGQFSSGFCDCCDGQGGSGFNIYNSNGTVTGGNRNVQLNGAPINFTDSVASTGYIRIENNRDAGLFSIKKRGEADSLVYKYDFGSGNDYGIFLDGPTGLRSLINAAGSEVFLGSGFEDFHIQANLDTVNTGDLILGINPITRELSVTTRTIEPPGAGYIAEIHVDSFGAIPNDGIDDSQAFITAWDSLVARGAHTFTQSPGGEYNLDKIDLSLYSRAFADSSRVFVEMNGGIWVMEPQTTEQANIVISGTDNLTIRNGTIKGRTDATNTYNQNNSFIYAVSNWNLTFSKITFLRPYSHAVVIEDCRLTTGTEKRCTTFDNCDFTNHLDNILEYDSRYSYVLGLDEAEYQTFNNVKWLRGQGGYRTTGGANDIHNNCIALDMGVPDAFFDPDSILQTGIIYYDVLTGGNSGKNQFTNLKFNHNDRILLVNLKQEPGNSPPRTSRFYNCDFLVNGADTELGQLANIENGDYTVFDGCTFRPRQNPGEPTIIISGSRDVTVSNSQILGTSGGVDAFLLINSNVLLYNFYTEGVNNMISPGSVGGKIMYQSSENAPVYDGLFQAQSDSTLGQNSLFKINGETSIQRLDTSALISSVDKPYFVFDDSTRVSVVAQSSATEAVQIAQNDVPLRWKSGKVHSQQFRFKMDTVISRNKLFEMFGTDGYTIAWRTTNVFEVVYNNGSATTEDTLLTAITIEPDVFYTVQVEFTEQDTMKVFLGTQAETMNQILTFEITNFDISNYTNALYWGGRGINVNVGFSGTYDYIEWQGSRMRSRERIEFGLFDPPVTYSTTGSVQGIDYQPLRTISNDLEYATQDDRLIITVKELVTIYEQEQSSNFTAEAKTAYPVNSTAGAITVNPISSPNPGDRFLVFDSRSTAIINGITIDFITAGQNLNGNSSNYTIALNGQFAEFRYINSAIGWALVGSGF